MSIIRSMFLNARTQDSTQATIADTSNYGTPEVNRNQEAHWLLVAKMDENQQLVFNTTITNNDPLNQLSWTFIQGADGAYRIFIFNPNYYAGGINYVAEIASGGVITTYGSIVWGANTAKFYKAIVNSINIEPGVTGGWQTYWTLMSTDLAWIAQIKSNIVPIYIFDDVITFRFEDCLMLKIDAQTDDMLCSVCANFDQLTDVLSMQLMLDGIKSNNWQNRATKAEVDIVEATKKYCC